MLFYLCMGDTPGQAAERSETREFPFTLAECEEMERRVKADGMFREVAAIQERISSDITQYPLIRSAARIRQLQNTADVIAYRIDPRTGRKKPTTSELTKLAAAQQSIMEKIREEAEGGAAMDIQGIVQNSDHTEKRDLLYALIEDCVRDGFLSPAIIIERTERFVKGAEKALN